MGVLPFLFKVSLYCIFCDASFCYTWGKKWDKVKELWHLIRTVVSAIFNYKLNCSMAGKNFMGNNRYWVRRSLKEEEIHAILSMSCSKKNCLLKQIFGRIENCLAALIVRTTFFRSGLEKLPFSFLHYGYFVHHGKWSVLFKWRCIEASRRPGSSPRPLVRMTKAFLSFHWVCYSAISTSFVFILLFLSFK